MGRQVVQMQQGAQDSRRAYVIALHMHQAPRFEEVEDVVRPQHGVPDDGRMLLQLCAQLQAREQGRQRRVASGQAMQSQQAMHVACLCTAQAQ